MFLMVNYMKKAIFLDRDGVINKEVNYLIRKKDIKIINGVPEALKELKDRGFMLIVISNQPSVARGWVTKEGIEEINNEINRRIKEKSDIEIDKFYFCPHHPNATLKKSLPPPPSFFVFLQFVISLPNLIISSKLILFS